ncbi:hypothetical protein [Bacillus thuringiensis]|uniref:hypothetical protein n=1 Tax=Bacillus thuringiensis TaxID=1428 RepID=UPI003B98063A
MPLTEIEKDKRDKDREDFDRTLRTQLRSVAEPVGESGPNYLDFRSVQDINSILNHNTLLSAVPTQDLKDTFDRTGRQLTIFNRYARPVNPATINHQPTIRLFTRIHRAHLNEAGLALNRDEVHPPNLTYTPQSLSVYATSPEQLPGDGISPVVEVELPAEIPLLLTPHPDNPNRRLILAPGRHGIASDPTRPLNMLSDENVIGGMIPRFTWRSESDTLDAYTRTWGRNLSQKYNRDIHIHELKQEVDPTRPNILGPAPTRPPVLYQLVPVYEEINRMLTVVAPMSPNQRVQTDITLAPSLDDSPSLRHDLTGPLHPTRRTLGQSTTLDQGGPNPRLDRVWISATHVDLPRPLTETEKNDRFNHYTNTGNGNSLGMAVTAIHEFAHREEHALPPDVRGRFDAVYDNFLRPSYLNQETGLVEPVPLEQMANYRGQILGGRIYRPTQRDVLVPNNAYMSSNRREGYCELVSIGHEYFSQLYRHAQNYVIYRAYERSPSGGRIPKDPILLNRNEFVAAERFFSTDAAGIRTEYERIDENNPNFDTYASGLLPYYFVRSELRRLGMRLPRLNT